MNIDNKILTQIENLAKLRVSPKDKALTQQKIESVLDMLDKVDINDIQALEPLYHPLEIDQIMRADQANPQIDRELLQSNAPKAENGLFLVPKVID